MKWLAPLFAVVAFATASPAHAAKPEFEPYLDWSAGAGLAADVDQDATTPNGRAGFLLDAEGHASGGTLLPRLTLGDGEIAFFGFTALGAGVDADFQGELESCEGCDGPGEVIADFELAATILWVDVLYGETYQRPVAFDDGYWRPESGLAGRTIGLRYPGFFQLKGGDNGPDTSVEATLLGGEVRRRELFEVKGPSWAADGGRIADEYRWSVYAGFFQFDYPHLFFNLDFVRYSFHHWITPTPVDEGGVYPYVRTYAPGAQFAGQMSLDIFDLELDFSGFGRLGLNFGVSSMVPTGLEDTGKAEGDMRYKWAIEYGRSLDRTPVAGRFGWNAGVRSFHRLDPTGLAVDAGARYLVSGSVRATDRLRFDASGTLAVAKRRLVSPFAEPGDLSFGEGDRIVMGRAAIEASWELNSWLSATTEIWGERSDRTDPMTFADEPGVTPLRGGWGGWIGLRADFAR